MSETDSPGNGDDAGIGDIGKFDPGLTQRLISVLRPVLKTYHRSQVHGLDSFPPGGALVVANHSGGMFPMDVPVFSVDFYDKFGYDRPVYTLSHDILFMGLTGDLFRRTGYIRATRENAAKALRSGGVVVVFPGGDYDAYRPTFAENVIDFNGSTRTFLMACKDYRLRSRIRAKLAPAREFACLKPRPYDGNSFVVTVVVQHAGPVMKRGFGDE